MYVNCNLQGCCRTRWIRGLTSFAHLPPTNIHPPWQWSWGWLQLIGLDLLFTYNIVNSLWTPTLCYSGAIPYLDLSLSYCYFSACQPISSTIICLNIIAQKLVTAFSYVLMLYIMIKQNSDQVSDLDRHAMQQVIYKIIKYLLSSFIVYWKGR